MVGLFLVVARYFGALTKLGKKPNVHQVKKSFTSVQQIHIKMNLVHTEVVTLHLWYCKIQKAFFSSVEWVLKICSTVTLWLLITEYWIFFFPCLQNMEQKSLSS